MLSFTFSRLLSFIYKYSGSFKLNIKIIGEFYILNQISAEICLLLKEGNIDGN